MAMKQTQTKLFDFSDVGLDFCLGSKALLPDRFKKMLSLGYNVQTVISVSVTGNQVTFTYGGAHDYVADRVLKVDSGTLLLINGGEFRIDSTTTNTVTFTLDDAPLSIAGGFTTKVSSLGWELVFDQPFLQVYKMLHLDDTPRYVRILYQSAMSLNNNMVVGIGKSFDAETGDITDPLALQSTATATDPNAQLPKWAMYNTAAAHNNYTYAQGYATYGRGMAVGSKYHFIFSGGNGYPTVAQVVYGVLPCASLPYESLAYPLVLTQEASSIANIYGNLSKSGNGRAHIGSISVNFCDRPGNGLTNTMNNPATAGLPTSVVEFNVLPTRAIEVYESTSILPVGHVYGLFIQLYLVSTCPQPSVQTYPKIEEALDGTSTAIFASGSNNIASNSTTVFALAPIEEIKLV